MSVQFVNIAIVLIAMYVALALACSWIQEQIAAWTQLRPKTLVRGITALVSNEAAIFSALERHPLIVSGADRDHRFPAYLDKRNFSLAYWQAIATAAAPAQPLLAQIASSAAIADLIAVVNAWAPGSTSATIDAKRSAVALLTSAQGDYEKLLAATDDWFDSQMDRVSGWYKRQTQFVMLGIALGLAIGTGFDTIGVARQLFAQPEIANALAQSESKIAAEQTGSDGIVAVANALAQSQQLQTLQLFWWSPSAKIDPRIKTPPVTPENPPEKMAGILLTAIAISLGAPFWFDLLKTLVNVRMAGNKPPDDRSSTASTPGGAPIATPTENGVTQARRALPTAATDRGDQREIGARPEQPGPS